MAFIFFNLKQDTSTFYTQQNSVSVWTTDSTLIPQIFKLYSQHGSECCHHIKSTTFVLYDAATDLFVATRDYFGLVPIFYTYQSSTWLVSFSLPPLITSGHFSPLVHAAKVIDYLDFNQLDALIDTDTLYKDVYRVLPAYVVWGKKGEIEMKPCFKLDLKRHKGLSDDEYISRFRDFFIKSVKQKLASLQIVGSELSGGLDSSSVSSVAQSLHSERLHTFYIHTQIAKSEEATYAQSVQKQWGTNHQIVVPQNNVYRSIQRLVEKTALPEFGVLPSSFYESMIENVANLNCEVFLSGHGGDQVVGFGLEYLEELYEAKDWSNLRKNLNLFASYPRGIEDMPSRNASFIIQFFLNQWKKKYHTGKNRWLWLLYFVGLMNLYFGCKITDLLQYWQKRKASASLSFDFDKLFKKEFLEYRKVKDISRPTVDINFVANDTLSIYQNQAIKGYFSTASIETSEEFYQCWAFEGIRRAWPFYDVPLVELALNVPMQLRFGDGITRGVLRKALSDYLPEAIVSRTTKAEFSDYSQKALESLYREFIDGIDDTHPIWNIIEPTYFNQLVSSLMNKKYSSAQTRKIRWIVCRVIYLAIWLEYLEKHSKL